MNQETTFTHMGIPVRSVCFPQIPADDGVTAPNLQRVLSVIDQAEAGTDLIVFPETCLMG